MSSLLPRNRPVALLVALTAILGCSDDSTPTTPEPGTGGLECEILSYPCSLSEVDLPVLLRSNELADSALALLEDGASTAEAADWLNGQEGMADVMSGNLGVWFRLEEGRGTWVVTEGAFVAEPDPSAAPTGPGVPDGAPARPMVERVTGPVRSNVTSPPPAARTPAAEDGRSAFGLSALAGLTTPLGREDVGVRARSGIAAPAQGLVEPPPPGLDIVGSEFEDKTALVLSPALWDFGSWDSGPSVAAILASTRGYENGVTLVANADSMDTAVGLASFTGWGAYDVVHVDTHGARVCDEAGCRGVLFVNPLNAFFPEGLSDVEQIEKLKEVNQPGVELIKSGNGGSLGINADFFWNQPADLVDTVIFLNACQLFGDGATDLVDALAGVSNVVFGWTEAVWSSDAYYAAIELYHQLGEGGYPAETAYEKLGALRTGSPTRHGPAPTLRMARRASGGDLQIREVVTLLNPGSGQGLGATDRIRINGTPRDGEEDAAPFLVQVDGVLPEHADDMTLYVSVDGIESDPVPVGSGTANEKDQWIVEGEIPLGYDLDEDRPVDFLARVELASGGESEDRSGAILTGGSWTLVSEGSTTATVTLHGSNAQGAYSWTSEARFAVDGGGRVVGEGMGFLSGTELVFSFDDEEIYCLVAAPVELGYVFDITGQVQEGGLQLQAENLQAAEFTTDACGDSATEAEIEASLLAVISATLETAVPFEHEERQEVEQPTSGPLTYNGVVVGSYEGLYQWMNTIRKEGCPVGGGDGEC